MIDARVVASLFVVLAWWAATALVLRLVWTATRHGGALPAASSALALGALAALVAVRDVSTATSAYIGFAAALTLWGWHELAFLLGRITGPRRVAADPRAQGWARFRDAALTLIHHELALAATVVVLVALSWGGANHVGAMTFTALWAMRLSSKLNLFLGVRNVTEEFVPPHLGHLVTYFRRAPLNPLMPFSLAACGLGTGMLFLEASRSEAGCHGAVGAALVGTLVALGALEHLFLTVPLPDAKLWRWVLPAPKLGDDA